MCISERTHRGGSVQSKKKFPEAHIDKAKGSPKQNRDYVAKEGKWAGSNKAETKVQDSFFEFGTLPATNNEKNKPTLVELMKDGYTDLQILEEYPSYTYQVNRFPVIREIVNAEKAKGLRNVIVTYLYGVSGTGKTKFIFDNYSQDEVFRITNYPKTGVRFDGYSDQRVLVFEEFASNISIRDMLNYLDIYPIKLPARYSDHSACYTRVYITSNLSLEEQYTEMDHDSETWKALMRRIANIVHFTGQGEYEVEKGDFEMKKSDDEEQKGEGEIDENERRDDKKRI